MKALIFFVALFGLSVAPAFAGDGQISKSDLSRMGLSGMRAMTDADAISIRGTSIAIAQSFSFASGGTTFTFGNPVGTHFAFSASISVSSSGAFAGGFASASAH